MARFLNDREFLSGRAPASQALTDTAYPVPDDPALAKGTWMITQAGQMQWSSGEDWVPLAPPGTEMMIPPWVDVPQGWFEISAKHEGAFANRRVIANLFDFGYVEENLVTWLLPLPANMFETSAGLVQVGVPPSPTGLVLDASQPRIDWSQPVSGNRPVWGQITRAVGGVNQTINQITFNRLGQTLTLTNPAPFSGTMMVCTSQGIYALGVSIPAGTYTYGRWDIFPVEEILIFDKFLTQTEIEAFKDYLVAERYRVRDNFGAVTNLQSAWRDRTDIISFPVINTSAVTSMGSWASGGGTWRGCSNMQAFPNLDTSQLDGCSEAWRFCSSLTSFPELAFPKCRDFKGAWSDCTGLTSFPVLNMAQGVGPVNAALEQTWARCANLPVFPRTIMLPVVPSWSSTWEGCAKLDNRTLGIGTNPWSFPPFDASAVTNMTQTWLGCAELKNFPPLSAGNVTSFQAAWSGCSKINNIVNPGDRGPEPYSFPLIDTSKGTNFQQAWRNCLALTSFPPLNFSAAVGVPGAFSGFRQAWNGCSALTTFPANLFDLSQTSNYEGAFTNCALTQASVNNILVSIATAAVAFNLNNGVLNMTGGTSAAPSAAGITARNDLIARGWTVTTN